MLPVNQLSINVVPRGVPFNTIGNWMGPDNGIFLIIGGDLSIVQGGNLANSGSRAFQSTSFSKMIWLAVRTVSVESY